MLIWKSICRWIIGVSLVWLFLLILPFLVPHIARLYSLARFYAGFSPVPITQEIAIIVLIGFLIVAVICLCVADRLYMLVKGS